MIGDDGRRALHDRHPVRIGGLRHQHGAVDETVDVLRAVDDADAARHHGVADAEACHQLLALRLDAIGAEGGCRVLRLHRLRPRLHDEQVAGLAVLRPFHVHGPAVVLLDDDGPARKLQNVAVGKNEACAFRLRGRHVLGRMRGRRPYRSSSAPSRRKVFSTIGMSAGIRQQRLEHHVFVRIDGALHHVFAEAPGGVDQDDLVESRSRYRSRTSRRSRRGRSAPCCCTPIESATFMCSKPLAWR